MTQFMQNAFGRTGERLETSELFREIPAPVDPRCQAMAALWVELCPADSLPARSDFTFERLQAIGVLGNTFVIEPIGAHAVYGIDWRYRLMGTNIAWMFGSDPTGLPFSEHFLPDEARVCIDFSNQVAASRKPVFLMGKLRSGDYSGTLETMSLPVLAPDGEAVWLLGVSFAAIDKG
ncbi:PAS domain-containing protein [Ferrovibrio sp.]|uniref:PAS domain-containing protein n=1 Tax=Ferrovibrio sp. TaxID=1917215 RepID=UPI0025C06AF8|nr:PAS domain-containing protein [Ferrovibrio sp.]MBX3452964.1 PAS domain-containing protein [Ferrovibrio sp.]